MTQTAASTADFPECNRMACKLLKGLSSTNINWVARNAAGAGTLIVASVWDWGLGFGGLMLESRHLGESPWSRKDSSMSEAVEKRRARFTPEVLEQMQKLGRMISAETYGEDGPPMELTWNVKCMVGGTVRSVRSVLAKTRK